MRVKLWRGIGTRRTSIYSLLPDGRFTTRQRNGNGTQSMGINSGPEHAFDGSFVDMIDQIWCNSSGMFMAFLMLILLPSMYHYTRFLIFLKIMELFDFFSTRYFVIFHVM
jgi:hypothetical protein